MMKGIIFDFDQTLVDSADGFRSAEKLAQQYIFEFLGLESRDDFLSHYRAIRYKFKGSSNFARKSMWKEVIAFYKSDYDHSLLDKWESIYWDKVREHTRPFPETLRVLEMLSGIYSLAVITNTQGGESPGKHRINDFHQLRNFFETVIIAGEYDIPPKPHSMPFEICVDRLGMEKDRVTFVGDDWHADIQGALNSGISAIWLKHHSTERNWPAVDTTVPVITSLDELKDLNLIMEGKTRRTC